MEEEFTIPRSIRVLADALRPVAVKIEKRINGALIATGNGDLDSARLWVECRAAESAARRPPEAIDDQCRIGEEHRLFLLLLGAFGLGWMFGGDE